jgi:hypothetical protein
MKRYFVVLCIAMLPVAFLSCNTHTSKVDNNHSAYARPGGIDISNMPNDSIDYILNNLLNASAVDFNEHQPPIPLDFRKVRFSYLTKSGERLHT